MQHLPDTKAGGRSRERVQGQRQGRRVAQRTMWLGKQREGWPMAHGCCCRPAKIPVAARRSGLGRVRPKRGGLGRGCIVRRRVLAQLALIAEGNYRHCGPDGVARRGVVWRGAPVGLRSLGPPLLLLLLPLKIVKSEIFQKKN